jgi:chemotaxis protein MotB
VARPVSGSAPPSAVAPRTAPVAWPTIGVKGVQSRPTGNSLTLVFDEGVFSRRAEIAPEAKPVLRQVAQQLKTALTQFRLEIEGHTDADPVMGVQFADNHELGLKRAEAVKDYLGREAGLPAAALTTTSAGEENPPYPNTTPETRRKNRTVVLKLTLAHP